MRMDCIQKTMRRGLWNEFMGALGRNRILSQQENTWVTLLRGISSPMEMEWGRTNNNDDLLNNISRLLFGPVPYNVFNSTLDIPMIASYNNGNLRYSWYNDIVPLAAVYLLNILSENQRIIPQRFFRRNEDYYMWCKELGISDGWMVKFKSPYSFRTVEGLEWAIQHNVGISPFCFVWRYNKKSSIIQLTVDSRNTFPDSIWRDGSAKLGALVEFQLDLHKNKVTFVSMTSSASSSPKKRRDMTEYDVCFVFSSLFAYTSIVTHFGLCHLALSYQFTTASSTLLQPGNPIRQCFGFAEHDVVSVTEKGCVSLLSPMGFAGGLFPIKKECLQQVLRHISEPPEQTKLVRNAMEVFDILRVLPDSSKNIIQGLEAACYLKECYESFVDDCVEKIYNADCKAWVLQLSHLLRHESRKNKNDKEKLKELLLYFMTAPIMHETMSNEDLLWALNPVCGINTSLGEQHSDRPFSTPLTNQLFTMLVANGTRNNGQSIFELRQYKHYKTYMNQYEALIANIVENSKVSRLIDPCRVEVSVGF